MLLQAFHKSNLWPIYQASVVDSTTRTYDLYIKHQLLIPQFEPMTYTSRISCWFHSMWPIDQASVTCWFHNSNLWPIHQESLLSPQLEPVIDRSSISCLLNLQLEPVTYRSHIDNVIVGPMLLEAYNDICCTNKQIKNGNLEWARLCFKTHFIFHLSCTCFYRK